MSTHSSPPIVLLIGDAAVRVRQAEDALVSAVLGDSRSAFNHAVFSAGDGATEALEVARTQAMMSPVRVVVVRELEKATPALLQGLLEYAEAPNPSTVLVITGAKTPPASGGKDLGRVLANKLKKSGRVERFKTANEDPVRFAQETATRLGASLDRRAAALLVQLVGHDLGQLQTEVDKAVAYASSEGAGDPIAVTAAHVEAVSSVVAEAVVWDLTDAIVRRDPDACLAVAHRLLEDGDATHRLLAMITWQIRQLLVLQDCERRGVDTRAAGLRMPGSKLRAARQALRQRPLDEARILGRLTRANRDFNRSRAGDRRVFEALLLDLATG